MQLEKGKRYVVRNGQATQPLISDIDQFTVRSGYFTGTHWHPNGKYVGAEYRHDWDIIGEYSEPREPSITDGVTPAEEDILHEAFRLTGGDRQQDYGSPADNFACIAKMWSALKGIEFTTSDVALFQICVKLSREAHHSKRDNAVDMAGYARCLHICNEAAKAGQ